MVFESYNQKQVSLDSPGISKARKIYCKIHKKFFYVNEGVKVEQHAQKLINQPNDATKHESFCEVYGSTGVLTTDVEQLETEDHVPVHKSHYTWCHSSLSRLEAQEHLLSRKEEGMYLVRNSSQPDIQHVLSLYHQDKVYHMKIRQVQDKFMIGDERSKEPVFSSLQALVIHFQKLPIFLNQDKSIKCLLRVPLPH